jgi:hypothetical protein
MVLASDAAYVCSTDFKPLVFIYGRASLSSELAAQSDHRCSMRIRVEHLPLDIPVTVADETNPKLICVSDRDSPLFTNQLPARVGRSAIRAQI